MINYIKNPKLSNFSQNFSNFLPCDDGNNPFAIWFYFAICGLQPREVYDIYIYCKPAHSWCSRLRRSEAISINAINANASAATAGAGAGAVLALLSSALSHVECIPLSGAPHFETGIQIALVLRPALLHSGHLTHVYVDVCVCMWITGFCGNYGVSIVILLLKNLIPARNSLLNIGILVKHILKRLRNVLFMIE